MQQTVIRRFIQGALDGAQSLTRAPAYARQSARDRVALRLCAPPEKAAPVAVSGA